MDDLKTEVNFDLYENGTISAVHVTKSSGNAQYDREAMSAIEEGVPYQPCPVAVIRIDATFENKNLDRHELARNQQLYRQRHQSASVTRFASPVPTFPPTERQTQPMPQNPGNFYSQPTPYPNAGTFSRQDYSNLESKPEIEQPQDANDPSRRQIENAGSEIASAISLFQTPIELPRYRGLTEEQQRNYLSWFSAWIRTPPMERFSFLFGNSNSGGSPGSSRRKTK